MIKVNEKIDLSKQVLEIDIDSPVFNCLRQDLNKEIKRCVSKVYDEEFEAGEITVKLNLEISNDYKTIPRKNTLGEIVEDTYRYKKPYFKHTVTSTLKKRFKQEGIFTGEREVIFEDGEFITVPIKDPQMTFDDLEVEE